MSSINVKFEGTLSLSGFENIADRHKLRKAQKIVDSEVLRYSEKYVPMQTGMLLRSGPLSTDIGSGVVTYNTPYAYKQYYFGRAPGTSNKGRKRGRMWFERMKADCKSAILRAAKCEVK